MCINVESARSSKINVHRRIYVNDWIYKNLRYTYFLWKYESKCVHWSGRCACRQQDLCIVRCTLTFEKQNLNYTTKIRMWIRICVWNWQVCAKAARSMYSNIYTDISIYKNLKYATGIKIWIRICVWNQKVCVEAARSMYIKIYTNISIYKNLNYTIINHTIRIKIWIISIYIP